MFFFSFTVHYCFMTILKASVATNAGQSHRLTHCIKNLHGHNLKSLLFIHTFKITTQLLLFITVSDFSARKKKMKPDTSGSIFPTTPRQRSNPYPRVGLRNQISHSPGTEIVKCPGFAREGMLKFRFDRRMRSVVFSKRYFRLSWTSTFIIIISPTDTALLLSS